jgi:hypothetical protein
MLLTKHAYTGNPWKIFSKKLWLLFYRYFQISCWSSIPFYLPGKMPPWLNNNLLCTDTQAAEHLMNLFFHSPISFLPSSQNLHILSLSAISTSTLYSCLFHYQKKKKRVSRKEFSYASITKSTNLPASVLIYSIFLSFARPELFMPTFLPALMNQISILQKLKDFTLTVVSSFLFHHFFSFLISSTQKHVESPVILKTSLDPQILLLLQPNLLTFLHVKTYCHCHYSISL